MSCNCAGLSELPCKQAAETIMLTFDFEPTVLKLGLADVSLINPQFTIEPETDEDEPALGVAVVHGPVYDGLKGFVWVALGVGGQRYKVAMSASFLNLERRTLEAVLPVVGQPGSALNQGYMQAVQSLAVMS